MDEIEVTEVEESVCEETVQRDLNKLENEILARSKSDNILESLSEWVMTHFFFSINGRKCACGKHNAKECLVLRNSITGKFVIASLGCVSRLNQPKLLIEKKIFSSIKRILIKKGDSHASSALVQFAFDNGRINKDTKERYLVLVTGHGGRTKFYTGHEHYNETAVKERRDINRLIILGLDKNLPRCNCKKRVRAKSPLGGEWTYDEENQEYYYSCPKCDYSGVVIPPF